MSPWAKFSSLRIPYTIEYPSAISAYRLPSTIPFRSSSNAPPQPSDRAVPTMSRRGRCKSRKVVRNVCGPSGGPHTQVYGLLPLRDADVLASTDDVEDREVRGLRHVARPLRRSRVPREEADGEAEQRARLREVRLLDELPHLRAGGGAVLAGLVDGGRVDESRGIARQAERLGLATVPPLVRLQRRAVEVDREGGDVGADGVERPRCEQAVGAEHDRPLPRRPQLVEEDLSLGRELPRDVHDLRVRRDARDQRREVRHRLAHVVTRDVVAGLAAEQLLHLVGEPLAVRLLVVDDVDALLLQRAADVARDPGSLLVVVRDRAVEVPEGCLARLPRLRAGESHTGSRARHDGEALALVDGDGVLDLLAPGGPDQAQDLRVRRELMRDRERLGRVRKLRVALDEAELLRVMPVVARDEELRPPELLEAERRGVAGNRCRDPDRAGLAALDECAVRARGGGGPARAAARPQGGRRQGGQPRREHGGNYELPHTALLMGFGPKGETPTFVIRLPRTRARRDRRTDGRRRRSASGNRRCSPASGRATAAGGCSSLPTPAHPGRLCAERPRPRG